MQRLADIAEEEDARCRQSSEEEEDDFQLNTQVIEPGNPRKRPSKTSFDNYE